MIEEGAFTGGAGRARALRPGGARSRNRAMAIRAGGMELAMPGEAVASGGRRAAAHRRIARHRQRRGGPLGGRIKRAADLAIAVPALLLFMPLLLVLAVLVRRHDGGPAIYGHLRIGYGGRPFQCLKLRSMVVNGDEVLARHLADRPAARAEWRERQKLADDPRVTPIGRFLRRTSLDELPQIINVLRGQMSIVGPRPVTSGELARYGPGAESYLATRPGVTGLWQVSGRNDVSYERRVELDGEYVRRWSILHDTRIIIRTVPAVLRARGTS